MPITSGTGTNIDTRTESTNGNHRQVVVLGDPSTDAGVAPVNVTSGLKVDLGTDNDVTVTGSVSSTVSSSVIPGFNIPAFDYLSLALTSSTVETYTYKSGGSGGSTVATITVTYTDSSKGTISNVAKT